ncbi:MAG: ATP-binding cassette domain-containing protein, partial [Actinomycetota bacterium]|nr:ATP-binding cassette domain-containing protein [Actinomycetota bacterium]
MTERLDDPPAAVEARSLYRFFRAGDDETLALQGVTVCVEAGEFVAVVGPSGSGKSTLLACLAGTDEPDGGTVRIG